MDKTFDEKFMECSWEPLNDAYICLKCGFRVEYDEHLTMGDLVVMQDQHDREHHE